jgi:hypothetical protein
MKGASPEKATVPFVVYASVARAPECLTNGFSCYFATETVSKWQIELSRGQKGTFLSH